MKLKRARIKQIISILVIQGLVLIALQALLPGLRNTSFWSALGAALGYSIAQAVFWYVFIKFLSWLPEILYPFFTFVLSGVAVFWLTTWCRATLSIVNPVNILRLYGRYRFHVLIT